MKPEGSLAASKKNQTLLSFLFPGIIAVLAIAVIVAYFLLSHHRNASRGKLDLNLSITEGKILDIMSYGYSLSESDNDYIVGCNMDKEGVPGENVHILDVSSGKTIIPVHDGKPLHFLNNASISRMLSGDFIISSTTEAYSMNGFFISRLSSSGTVSWMEFARSGYSATSILSGENIFVATAFEKEFSLESSGISYKAESNALCLLMYDNSGKVLSSVCFAESTKKFSSIKLISDGNEGIWLTSSFSGKLSWNEAEVKTDKRNILLAHFTPDLKNDVFNTIPSREFFSLCSDNEGGGWIAAQSPVAAPDLLPFQGTEEKQIFIGHFDSSGSFDRGRSISGQLDKVAIAQIDKQRLMLAARIYNGMTVYEPFYSFESRGEKGLILSINPDNLRLSGRSVFEIDGAFNTIAIAMAGDGKAKVFARFWGKAMFPSDTVSCERGILKTIMMKVDKTVQ